MVLLAQGLAEMSIETEADLVGLTQIGRIVALTLLEMQRKAKPGMTTAELDAIGAGVLAKHGARPTPRDTYNFPGAVCISVNEQAVHGVPGSRVMKTGDVVKIDVTADLDGYVADAARSVILGRGTRVSKRLAECARSAFLQAMNVATAGRQTRDIGRAVDTEVRRYGFSVMRQMFGHGVGRQIHESPSIPSYYEPRCRDQLTEGLVITVEPIIAAGSGRSVDSSDGWTVTTADRSLTAHHEETIIITRGRPIILTAA
jgi:methionyl aminopeptidase